MNANPRMLVARRLVGRLAQRPRRRGFTLIELLVVVVIIGILASMALPSFLGAQDKAKNASVQANVKAIQLALEEFAVDNNGSYPAFDWSTPIAAGSDPFINGTNTKYLPGNRIPRSPWAKNGNQTAPVAAGTQPAYILAQDTTFASGNMQLPNVGSYVSDAPGAAPTAGVDGVVQIDGNNINDALHYGAIMYDYDPNAAVYVIYSTGKKNKKAIVGARSSNGGN